MAFTKKTTVATKASAPKSSSGCDQFNKMVSERAYYIWESMGKPEGKDMEIWVKAEKELRSKK
jgi:hypothetical protein